VALRAARAGAAVIGIGESVEEARERARVEGLSIDFVVGDAERLPFSDGAFDVIVSSFGIIDVRELVRVARTRIGFTVWEPIEVDAAFACEFFERAWNGRRYTLVIGTRA
jgi:SAM-dependent methyltransferase